MPKYIFDCGGIVKTFLGVQALKSVDFAVEPGRIHGLVGENGAGKSTLLKIISGVHHPDSGHMQLDGDTIHLAGTDDALKKGIVTVHQDINLIESMTVAENIMLNNEPARAGLLRRQSQKEEVTRLLHDYGIEADPDSVISTLPNDVKKMVQILKAVSRNPRLLLLDEPTSALTDIEVNFVLDLIRALSRNGVGIVFVSHYLAEVFAVCDDITVLRDGAIVASTSKDATSLDEVIQRMVGRSLTMEPERPTSSPAADILLSVRNLSVRGGLDNVTFDLHRGEVLGFTGLTGSGLTELSRALFGSSNNKRSSGNFEIAGRAVDLDSPVRSIGYGMALLTHDRLRDGILPESPIYDNVCMANLDYFNGRFGLLDEKAMVETGRSAIERLRIRAPGPKSKIKFLSGGNQQKVLFAKWLETKPSIFILDEPTTGVDVGSKAEIHATIAAIVSAGVGVILISADLLDIERLCNRVLVMFRGSVVGEFSGASIRREAILATSVSGRMQ
ncbi:sugar ABC transporter ATP-binding protein [Paraburkholderia largidicola]|uniref:Monosaccharide-transporting ATPase n=1 Tax=Paraburkholderia largidicola TaxID=3014751 RepID=A0A7I8C2H4_9BURK|nr:sugar ABC transporter ATP-binding protein [Paraburkholderia sp. PGU16]BCF95043.1 monosaccharide-transporting ATPase [Paraburkholderia sp. PGU16]